MYQIHLLKPESGTLGVFFWALFSKIAGIFHMKALVLTAKTLTHAL